MLVVCGLPIFVILFVTIATALRQGSTYGKNAALVITLCVSLLCVMGLYRTFIPTSVNTDPPAVDFMLLIYTALAVAVLVLLFLVFVSRLMRGDGRKHFRGDGLQQRGSPYPPKCREPRSTPRRRPEKRRRDSDGAIGPTHGRRTRTPFRRDPIGPEETRIKTDNVGENQYDDREQPRDHT